MNWKNLLTRSLTGVLFLLVMIGGILWNVYSYTALFALITFLSMAEFRTLLLGNQPVARRVAAPLLAVSIFLLSVAVSGGWLDVGWLGLIPLATITVGVSALFPVSAGDDLRKNIFCAQYTILSLVYIVLPFALTAPLVLSADGSFSPLLLLSVFIFIWVGDSAAYFFGSLFGNRRLCERISPKKSWEGFLGGVLFSVLAGFIFSLYFFNLTAMEWMGLAGVTVLAGTLGDLFESLIKRTVGVKDSGTLLPGHGGMLDRFDAAFFALPVAFSYLWLLS